MTQQIVTARQFGKLALFILLMLLFMYYPTIERYKNKHVLNEGIAWKDMRVTGEITPEFSLRQSIRVENTDLLPTEFHNPVCLDIQFANYANRKNTGRLRIVASTASASEERVIEARNIEDNEMELVCFHSISFREIFQQDSWVDIQGIDSPRGKSVTTVGSTTAGPPRAVINRRPSDLTLVYIASIRKDPELYQINSYVLIVFASLLMTAILLASRTMVALPASRK